MGRLSKDTKEFIIGAVCVSLLMVLLYNLFIYKNHHIIEAYEGQIKLAQDSTLVDVIDNTSVDVIQNEETGIIRHEISSGFAYSIKGTYNDQGEILSIEATTSRPVAILGAILLGMLFGMLLTFIVVDILLSLKIL